MAMIYDMVTGKLITGDTNTGKAMSPERAPSAGTALQAYATGTPVEDMAPVDAYMVMLQELLKKL